MYFARAWLICVAKFFRRYLLTTILTALYHWPPLRCAAFSPAYDAPFLGGGMQSAFASWIGQPVVLQVALGDIKVPLRGKLLKEGGDTLRMRIGEGWDVDIYKTMVLAVEEDAMATAAA